MKLKKSSWLLIVLAATVAIPGVILSFAAMRNALIVRAESSDEFAFAQTPDAQQITLDRCGHVPQVERPDETNDLLMSFFSQAERSGLVPSSRAHADAQAA